MKEYNKEMSQSANEALNIWQTEIKIDGTASGMGENEIAQELLKFGYVEYQRLFSAYFVVSCYECSKVESKNNMEEIDGDYYCKDCNKDN